MLTANQLEAFVSLTMLQSLLVLPKKNLDLKKCVFLIGMCMLAMGLLKFFLRILQYFTFPSIDLTWESFIQAHLESMRELEKEQEEATIFNSPLMYKQTKKNLSEIKIISLPANKFFSQSSKITLQI